MSPIDETPTPTLCKCTVAYLLSPMKFRLNLQMDTTEESK